ncbi:MAG: cell division protein CrgA [Candidatus Nanopelagicales bacterium]
MAKEPDASPSTSTTPSTPKAAPSSYHQAKNATERKRFRRNRQKPVRLDSPRWLVPTMIAMFILGLVVIVTYYIAPEAPVVSTLGWWSVLIGFGFFGVGFVLATRWK